MQIHFSGTFQIKCPTAWDILQADKAVRHGVGFMDRNKIDTRSRRDGSAHLISFIVPDKHDEAVKQALKKAEITYTYSATV